MSSTVNNAFITLWTSEAKHAFGQTQSYLRDAVRVRRENADVVKFNKLAKGTATLDKPRHAPLTPMDVDHSTVSVSMGTVYGVEWIDDVDQVRTNLNLRQEYTQSVTRAVNNALDVKIAAALNASSNTVSLSNTLNKDGMVALHDQLTKNNVPLDGERYLVISSGGLKHIISDTTLTSTDWTMQQALQTGYVKNLLGFNVIVCDNAILQDSTVTAVADPGASKTYCYAFHKSAIGLGMAMDFTFSVDPIYERDLYQVMAKLVAGSVIIDGDGVCKAAISD